MRSGTKLVKTASRSALARGGEQGDCWTTAKRQRPATSLQKRTARSANPLLERAQPSSNRCETRGCSAGDCRQHPAACQRLAARTLAQGHLLPAWPLQWYSCCVLLLRCRPAIASAEEETGGAAA